MIFTSFTGPLGTVFVAVRFCIPSWMMSRRFAQSGSPLSASASCGSVYMMLATSGMPG